MRRIQKNKRLIVALALILLVTISIGYAALTTNLTINGTATVKSNSWSVYFDNVQVKTGSVSGAKVTTAPSTSGTTTTTLTWNVSMDTPGEFYEFNVDVVNAGSIDAMIGSLSNTTLTSDQADYLNYTVTYSDGSPIEQYDTLPANSTDTLKVRLEFRTDIDPDDLPEEAEQITLTYTSNYVQADSTNAKARSRYVSSAVIKVDGTAVGNNNVPVLKGGTSTITIDNGDGMENITYASSDTTVATVSNGTITGVDVGTATITLVGATSGAEKTITVEVKESIETATVKIDGTAVENENVTVYKGETSAISIDNSANYESVTYASSDTTVATVNSSGVITGVDIGTATITLTGATSRDTKTFTVEVEKKPIVVGDTVNYSTTLNGQTLNNWKVFYVDGDYTYLILDDYLPRAAVSNDLKTNCNLADGNGTKYATIKSTSTTNRTDLIDAMSTASNWSDLINNGEMDGTALSAAVKSDANVTAKGAPDVELWANSWNSASNGFSITITTSKNSTGYKVNNADRLSIPEGDKSKTNYSLYVPHTSAANSCNGYWLASPSVESAYRVMCVDYGGWVYGNSATSGSFAFRPVVCLPSNIIN